MIFYFKLTTNLDPMNSDQMRGFISSFSYANVSCLDHAKLNMQIIIALGFVRNFYN